MSEVLAMKVEKNVKIPKRKSKYPFDEMEPGSSFPYKGARTAAPIAFGGYLAKDMYKTTRDGDGWRFHLLKKIKRSAKD